MKLQLFRKYRFLVECEVKTNRHLQWTPHRILAKMCSGTVVDLIIEPTFLHLTGLSK